MTTAFEPRNSTMTLINGEFSVSEATQHLMKLYDDNLRYLGRLAFSQQIRFGATDEYAEAMLKALGEAKHETLALLGDAGSKGVKIKIETAVKISIAEQ